MNVDIILHHNAVVAFCAYLFTVNAACFGLFAWYKQSAQLGRRRNSRAHSSDLGLHWRDGWRSGGSTNLATQNDERTFSHEARIDHRISGSHL